MSDRVGPVSLESEQSQFLRDPFQQQQRNFSEDTQNAVDDEVREVISACETRAVEILERERTKLDEVRAILMDKEIIEREEFERLMGGSKPKDEDDTSSAPPASPPSAADGADAAA